MSIGRQASHAVGYSLFALATTVWAQSQTPFTHYVQSFVLEAVTQPNGAVLSAATFRNPPNPICSTNTSAAANVNTDCEVASPSNETSIAVNPTDPLNLVASANDFHYWLSSERTVYFTSLSRARMSTDGGRTWTSYAIDYSPYSITADPAVSFDAHGTAYLSALGYVSSQSLFCCTNPDVLVAHSIDGGKTWSKPIRVAAGKGTLGSPGIFNDRDSIAAWGDGNAIDTWTVMNLGQKGSYISSPIFAAVTHDGGNTWSDPVEISGSASFCVGAQGGNMCNSGGAPTPVVAADGSIYVSFITGGSDFTTGRDQYLVVKVDPNSGQRIAGPFKVADMVDGFTDFPYNAVGRGTYQDSQFRASVTGNLTADPTNANHLAVVWSDMRNSTLPAPADPYQAKTNSDIIVSQSYDGGLTWSAPVAIQSPGDQFMPWSAYDASGTLRIGYFDRSYDTANHEYGYTLATEKSPGSLSFRLAQLTTQLSNPTKDARFFSLTVNTAFPNPSIFIGDYSGIAVSRSGVAALWTDMRLSICFATVCASSMDAFYATSP
jgi:hypothetical protein